MMVPIVFISHANTDAQAAGKVAEALRGRGIEIRLDQDLFVGKDFVIFMNDALTESDYCLVLWSKNVSLSSYVGSEITAAFVIDVKQRPSYLLFARLDSQPLPALFRPRLCVDLAFGWERGIQKIVELVSRDTRVATSVGKTVVAPPCLASESPEGGEFVEVYVCSSVFERTLVAFADLTKDASVFLNNILERLEAPRSVDHIGRIGVRIAYFLRGPNGPLQLGHSLGSQGISDGTVIWLELECEPFVIGERVSVGEAASVRYRLGDDKGLIAPEAVVGRALNSASKAISEKLRKNGLRNDTLIPIGMLQRPGKRPSGTGLSD